MRRDKRRRQGDHRRRRARGQPIIPSQIAYANCRETTNDGSCVVDWTTAYDVIDSGASAGSGADDVTYHSLADPNAHCLQDASTQIGDIDFSPDATHMVELRGSAAAMPAMSQ